MKTAIQEKYVRGIIQDRIKRNVIQEKESRIDKLNKNPIIEDNPYVKVRMRNKNDNPYKYVHKFLDKKKPNSVYKDKYPKAPKIFQNKNY